MKQRADSDDAMRCAYCECGRTYWGDDRQRHRTILKSVPCLECRRAHPICHRPDGGCFKKTLRYQGAVPNVTAGLKACPKRNEVTS